MLKGKLSIFIIFTLIIALAGTTGIFLAVNMSKASSVSKAKIEFTLEGETKVYDGTPLELSGDSLTLKKENALPKGYTTKLICNDTLTNAGTKKVKPIIEVYDNYGKNVSNYYDCVITSDVTLKVEPCPLSISFDSNSKSYDGTPLNTTTFSVTGGKLVYGHKINPVYTSKAESIEDKKVRIEADIYIIDQDGNDVTENYVITDNLHGNNCPTFEITGQQLRVKTKDLEKEYDGTPLSYSGTDGLIIEGLKKGDVVSIIDPVSLTEVGEIYNELLEEQVVITDSFGDDVTTDYEIIIDDNFGKLKVTKKKIRVQLSSIGTVFNGNIKRSTNNECDVEKSDILPDNYYYSITYTKGFTEVVESGKGKNEAVVKIIDGSGEDCSDNFELTVVKGDVTITPLEISFVYDEKVEETYEAIDKGYEGTTRYAKFAYDKDRNIPAQKLYKVIGLPENSDLGFNIVFKNNIVINSIGTYVIDKNSIVISSTESFDMENFIINNVEKIAVIIDSVEAYIIITNLEELSKTFDRNPIVDPVIDTNSKGNPTKSYSVDGEEYTSDKPSAAGHYYIKVTTAETTESKACELIEEFEISKASLKGVSVTEYSGIYDGEEHNIVTSCSAKEFDNTDDNITWLFSSDGENWVPSIIVKNVLDSGTYYYKVSAPSHEEVTGEFTVTISKKTAGHTDPTAKVNLVYNGEEQELINTGTVDAAAGNIEYQLDDGEWALAIPKATNTKTYTINYRYVLDENYNDIPGGTLDVTIAKVDFISANVNGYTGTYDNSLHNIVASKTAKKYDNSTDNITWQFSSDGENWVDEIGAVSVLESGTYHFKASADDHNDYKGTFIVIISPLTIYISPTDMDNVTYGNMPEYNSTKYEVYVKDINENFIPSSLGKDILEINVEYYSFSEEEDNWILTSPKNAGYYRLLLKNMSNEPGQQIYYKYVVNEGIYSNYDVKCELDLNDDTFFGELTVDKKTATIYPRDQKMSYGETPVYPKYERDIMGLEYQDSITVEYDFERILNGLEITDISQLAVGEYSLYVKAIEQEFVDNYNFIVIPAILEVEKANFTDVEVVGYNKVYDGNIHSIVDSKTATQVGLNEITWLFSSDKEEWYEDIIVGNVSDSGVYYYKVSAPNHNDYTGEFEVTISKNTIEHTDPTAKTGLVYTSSAQALVNAGIINEYLGYIEYQINDGDWTTNIPYAIDAGTYVVKYRYIITDDSNYEDIEDGTLEVEIAKYDSYYNNPTAVGNLVYDTYSHALVENGVSDKGYIEYQLNDGEWTTTIPSAIDAGIYTINYKYVLTDNYVEIPSGSLEVVIDKATIDSYTNPTAKTDLVYSGIAKALVNAGDINEIYGHIEYQLDDGDWTTVIPKEIKAGTYIVNYRYVITNNNYNEILGSSLEITIEKATLNTAEITFEDKVVMYDGLEHTITITSTLSDDLTVTYSGSGINFGDYTITAYLTSNNYNDASMEATLTIVPCALTITSESLEKVYDGTPLKTIVDVDGYASSNKYDVIGLPDLFYIKVLFYSEITNVGTEENIFDYELYWKSNGLELSTEELKNFDSEEIYGTLTIKKADLYVSVNDVTITYGDVDYDDINYGYSISGNGSSINGLSVDVDVLGGSNDAGRYTLQAVVSGVSEDNCNIVCTDGTLIINKKSITLQSESLTKEYDGTPLQSTALISGYNVTYTASIEDAGSVQNTFTVDFDDDNYDITYIYGTLTITKKKLTLQSESFTKVYDGEGFALSSTIGGYSVDYNYDMITNVGTIQNTFTVNLNNEDNYDVTYIYGTLTITPRQLTITVKSATKVYDGFALTLNDWIATGLIASDTVSCTFDSESTITNVGKVVNMVEEVAVSSGNDNYNIIINPGTLEVTPRKITIATNSLTVDLTGGDSLDNTLRSYTILEGYNPTDLDIQYVDVEEEIGSTLNLYTVSGEVDNYNISFAFGTITFI